MIGPREVLVPRMLWGVIALAAHVAVAEARPEITPEQAAGIVPVAAAKAGAGITPEQAAGIVPVAAAKAGVGITPEQAAGIVPVGHQACVDACPAPLPVYAGLVSCADDGCSSSCDGCAQGCDGCSSQSTVGRLCDTFRGKKREVLRDHYRGSFDHYRHLHHPVCAPYCSPSWGYHQTCWRRFPEETLWCPECPSPFVTSPGMLVPHPAPVMSPPAAPAPAY